MKEDVSLGVTVLLLCMIENLIIKKLFKRKRCGTAEVSGDSSFWSTFCPPAKRGRTSWGGGRKAGEEGGTGEQTVRLHFCLAHPPYAALSPAGATTSSPVRGRKPVRGHWPRTQPWCPFSALLRVKVGSLPFAPGLPGALGVSLGQSSTSTAWDTSLPAPPLPPALARSGTPPRLLAPRNTHIYGRAPSLG